MNQQMLVAVIDRVRARFLTLVVPAEISDAGFTLAKQTGLTLPTGEASDRELWPSTKTGRNLGLQGQAHSYGDRRQEHAIEFERHFTREIVSNLHQLIQELHIQTVLLVAAPQILGLMRPVLESVLPENVKLTAVAKDLCYLTPTEIDAYLTAQSLIPAPHQLGISPT
jgi:protein required for attachment to host cells